jgi:hypothetical protein
MAFVALDVRDKTDAAGIVFVRGAVQTVFFEMCDFSSRCHGALLVGWGTALHAGACQKPYCQVS